MTGDVRTRVPNSEHASHAWRIDDIAPDFRLEDVWALPVQGGAEDFAIFLKGMAAFDPTNAPSWATRLLFDIRERLGEVLGWDDAARHLPIPGCTETTLSVRVPNDLRRTASSVTFDELPLTPLYLTDNEFAAELSNQTVHGVIHLAWVARGKGRYQAHMGIYVKPRGLLGEGYMALIRPFRYWVVYPALMRQIEQGWNARNS